MAPDDCLGRRAGLPFSRTFPERVQASLDVRGVSALFLVPRGCCWEDSRRSIGTFSMPALRQQIDCRAASELLSQLWSQLRCDGAAQLAVHVDYPNDLTPTL